MRTGHGRERGRFSEPLEVIPGREAQVKKSKAMVGGQGIVYLEAGCGDQVIVLLHGWGCSSLYWLPVLRRVPEAEFTVVAPDLPGFGDTFGIREWSFAACAQMVGEFVREVTRGEPGGIVLVGHSMGGSIGLVVAAQEGVSIKVLVLESSAPAAPVKSPRVERMRHLELSGTAGGWVDGVVQSWVHHEVSASDLAELIAVFRRTPVPVLRDSLRSIMAGIPDSVMDSIACRMVWLFGSLDANRDISAVRNIAPKWCAELVIFDQCGHTPHWEYPDRFAEFLWSVGRECKDRGLC